MSGSVPLTTPTLVLDVGGYTIKAGIGAQREPLKTIHNAIIRTKSAQTSSQKQTFIGAECSSITDWTGAAYRRPITRGFISDWHVESDILSHLFTELTDTARHNANMSAYNLLMTQQIFAPPTIRRQTDEIIFEKFGFAAFHRSAAAPLALRGYQVETQAMKLGKNAVLIVDIGYSATHIIPLLSYVPIEAAVRRINVGGKLLTNYLAEIVSYRYANVAGEFSTLNTMKEDACSISLDFMSDMEKRRTTKQFTQEYLLPNGTSRMTVRRRTPTDVLASSDTVIPLNNERIAVGEALFHPADIGIPECGLHEAIVNSISACDSRLAAMLYSHIVVVGGTSLMDGIIERLTNELLTVMPAEFSEILSVKRAADPINAAWLGGSVVTTYPRFIEACVTKAEYEERGENSCIAKFLSQ